MKFLLQTANIRFSLVAQNACNARVFRQQIQMNKTLNRDDMPTNEIKSKRTIGFQLPIS